MLRLDQVKILTSKVERCKKDLDEKDAIIASLSAALEQAKAVCIGENSGLRVAELEVQLKTVGEELEAGKTRFAEQLREKGSFLSRLADMIGGVEYRC